MQTTTPETETSKTTELKFSGFQAIFLFLFLLIPWVIGVLHSFDFLVTLAHSSLQ